MQGYPTIFNGVIFVEAPMYNAERIATIGADLSFVFGAQLKNLNDIKNNLSYQAGSLGCNCVSEFKYGQKSRWLAIDDVAFFGSGVATRLTSQAYQQIVDYIQQRDGGGL